MYALVRNLAGFPANPTHHAKLAIDGFHKGDIVKIENGVIAKAGAADTILLGIVAEEALNDNVYALVYDHPMNVYRGPYTGNQDPIPYSKKSVNDVGVIDADSADGPITILSVDPVAKTADFIITGHILMKG